MRKTTIYDISESIIYGESMGLSQNSKYQMSLESIKLLEKYKECMEKYKEYQTCKYLLEKPT